MQSHLQREASTHLCSTANRGVLNDIKVLEWAELVAGPYCAKLLADLGASVVKVEDPIQGDKSRHHGPFVQDTPHPEQSLLFLYLNTNKKGVTLDMQSRPDREQFLRLIKWADVLIEDNPLGVSRKLDLTYDKLRQVNPRLVMTSITPFGQTGPYCNYKAYPINVYHAGGLGYMSPQTAEGSEQRPIKPGGFFSEYACGLVAAQGTLAAIYAQQATGIGQHVDISKQEAILSLCRVQLARYPNEGAIQTRYKKQVGSLGVVQCKDGYAVITANQPHEFKAFAKLIGNCEWQNDEKYLDRDFRAANWDKILAQVNSWIDSQNKDEIYHQGQALGCPITPVMTAEDIYRSPQSHARQFFVEIKHPIAGSLKHPGIPYHFSATRPTIMQPAPLLGQHNNETISRALNVNDQVFEEVKPASHNPGHMDISEQAPLKGIRIADFSWMWAGAHATELLSFLGAEVIRVESMRHVDFTRIFSFTTGQKFNSINESPVFNDINLGKMSVQLNLGQPRGVELAKKLVSISDIVMQNMRPGVMFRLGLGYEDLRKVKPDIIYLSSSSRGAHGPERQYAGYAPNFAAWGGVSFITGRPDDKPAFLTGEIDLLSAITSAFAILAALIHRYKTREGQHIDLSSSEAISVLVGDVLMDYIANDRVQTRKGNTDANMAPHNCYRCKGEDKWISIAVATDEEWEALCRAMGNTVLTHEERFASPDNRLKNQEEIDRLIEQWTVLHTQFELMEMLQMTGVAAMPCFDAEELYNDIHLNYRQCWTRILHPVVGEKAAISPPWKLSATPARVSSPAPTFGQHSEYVLKELLGISDCEFESLVDEKVIY